MPERESASPQVLKIRSYLLRDASVLEQLRTGITGIRRGNFPATVAECHAELEIVQQKLRDLDSMITALIRDTTPNTIP